MKKKEKYESLPSETSNDILKLAIQSREATQMDVAVKLGMYQSGLSGILHRPKMTMYGFGTVLDALDYDVAVIDRKTGDAVWKVKVK